MKTLRLLAAVFAINLLTGCIDVAPTAPTEDSEECSEGGEACGGILGSGN